MTNYTPEQMRALADDLGRGNSGRYRSEIIADAESVIRSTADQLDAVWGLLPWQNPELMDFGYSIDASEVLAILTATPPKETTK